jgi:hypothetical protein
MAAPEWEERVLTLGEELLAQLAGQIGSVERMLELVVEQGQAIRARDPLKVVQTVGLLQGELAHRDLLERQRQELLERWATLLGVPVGGVTLRLICSQLPAELSARAQRRSAELRGMIAQLEREHAINRALLGVELAFLDHLLSELGDAAPAAYNAAGQPPPAGRTEDLHLLDMEA